MQTILDCPVHLIGLGMTGSHIGYHTGKWGAGAFPKGYHVHDGDLVESKNTRNQMYRPEHAKLHKTTALAQLFLEWGGIKAVEHPEYVTGQQAFSGVVFMCVDKMAHARTIWDTCIRGNDKIELFIETRVDASNVLMHVLTDLTSERQCMKWERYWYPDDGATNEGGCGGPDPVGSATADCAAIFATTQLRRHLAIRQGFDDVLVNQIRFNTRTFEVETYKW